MQNLNALELLDRWPGTHCIGDESLLRNNLLGVYCSGQCPPDITFRTLDLFQQMQESGVVLVGGFDAPAHRVWLDCLLRAKLPFVMCTSKGIADFRLPEFLQGPVQSGNLLIVSPFPRTIRRTSSVRSRTRDQFVAYIASALFVPFASAADVNEGIVGAMLDSRKPLFSVDDPANETLLQRGALPYDIEAIRRVTVAS